MIETGTEILCDLNKLIKCPENLEQNSEEYCTLRGLISVTSTKRGKAV